MTSPTATALYKAQHIHAHKHLRPAVFNPHNKPVSELPIIFGFNGGGSAGWLSAVLLAQDGTVLGSHCCSAEDYMPADLGILEGMREDRHREFRQHYPDGYRMEFVGYDQIPTHDGLLKAIELAHAMPD
jgi:hypothetical protein